MRTKSKRLKLISQILGTLVFVFSSISHAQDEGSEVPAASEAPKKVDVEGLEKRYWAPKDKSFSVVQNRTYTKTKKLALTVMPSLMLNEEYSEGTGFDLGLGYMFNDRWGIEGEVQTVSLSDNDLQKEVIGLNGFVNHGKLKNYFGVTGKWMPFYAKMSFLSKKILYFDMTLGLSAGMSTYSVQGADAARRVSVDVRDESAFTYGFEISQSFYVSKRMAIRFDYKHRWHTQDVFDYTTLSGSGNKLESRLEDNISLNLGLIFIFL